jgi:hypothetical protein
VRTCQLKVREREEWAGELGNAACHRGLTDWRRGKGGSAFVSSETWKVTNEDSLTGREKEGGVLS